MADLEQVTGPIAYHAEGPAWHPSWGGLRWVDMFAGDMLALDAASGRVTRTHLDTVAAAIRARSGGGMVAGITRGFALIDPDGGMRRLGNLWPPGPLRMNEGACDPHGRFYCGSMSQTPGAAMLYRLDTDLRVSVVETGITISNGLAWSPDGGCAYYIDTPTGRVDVFDYDETTGLTGRRPLIAIPVDHGHPDGLTVDADGYVWVALYNGGAVRRYSPDGREDAVVRLPVSKPTAVALGGDDLRSLYITTSREYLPADAEPEAGSLYRVTVDVPGVPLHTFAG
ncbi:MAG TPA: SMP-30/gluconolactonase/LRE family protein [Micromonosporaceae bacterium]|nr:SMP-30/gluconolactonase/LRE family protein [Micromonosporaceae bacterium]